ncbi:hypothetical protein G3N56_16545 [Desulfovibrio sulfodismutans]|uniref:Uncharacterized protein n=1 Tax=Desulfolutivibrio sulfodismutans TaxID=63561 RepID=A0A7K3NQ69_9BACT|nr:hypothetical protein [Desulfolutivibrio sulfodismutans]NDY58344.1 hypothetical protein [Desulfolutivibrio sulfodismutans]
MRDFDEAMLLFMLLGTDMLMVGEDSVAAMGECVFSRACQFTAEGMGRER